MAIRTLAGALLVLAGFGLNTYEAHRRWRQRDKRLGFSYFVAIKNTGPDALGWLMIASSIVVIVAGVLVWNP